MYSHTHTTIRNSRSKVKPKRKHPGHTLVDILAPILQSMAIVTNDELKELPVLTIIVIKLLYLHFRGLSVTYADLVSRSLARTDFSRS